MSLDKLLAELIGQGRSAGHAQRSLAITALDVFGRQTQDAAYGRLLNLLVLRYAQAERKLAALNRELVARQELLDKDLWAAAQIQRSLLPQKVPDLPGLKLSWRFEPCDMMGGDILNFMPLSADQVCCYLLDVSGHGVPAALVTVSVAQMLQPASGLVVRREPGQEGYTVASPKEVVAGLAREFPVERFDKTFSIVYLVLDIPTRRLTYCNAGHPAPLLVRADGDMRELDQGGAIIGFGGSFPYDEGEIDLLAGDKLFLFSDGLTEFEDAQGSQYGDERLRGLLARLASADVEESLGEIMREVQAFGAGAKPRDDISLLGCQVGA